MGKNDRVHICKVICWCVLNCLMWLPYSGNAIWGLLVWTGLVSSWLSRPLCYPGQGTIAIGVGLHGALWRWWCRVSVAACASRLAMLDIQPSIRFEKLILNFVNSVYYSLFLLLLPTCNFCLFSIFAFLHFCLSFIWLHSSDFMIWVSLWSDI